MMDPALARFRGIARRFKRGTGWEVGTPPERTALIHTTARTVHVNQGLDLQITVRPGWDGVDPDLIERFRDPDVLALLAVVSLDPKRADAEVRRIQRLAREALDPLRELSRIANEPPYGPPMTLSRMQALIPLHYLDSPFRELAYEIQGLPRRPVDDVVQWLETLTRPMNPILDDELVFFAAVAQIRSVNGFPVSQGTRDLLAKLARIPRPGRGRPRDFRMRAMRALLDTLKTKVRKVYGDPLSDSEALDLLALLDPLDRFRLHDPATRKRFVSAIRKRRQRA